MAQNNRSLVSRLSSLRSSLQTRATQTLAPTQQDYLTGLRGLLVLKSLAWILLQTFVPTIVSPGTEGPFYQSILRKVCSPLLWNQSLICSFFVILSARTVCVPFLQEPSVTRYAASLVARPLRVGVPLTIALIIAFAIFTNTGTAQKISETASLLQNAHIAVPRPPQSPLVAFNAIFNTLWVVRDFSLQAANQAWPSATLWVPSLVYSQSYTVYIAMVILPFTRPSWHIQGLLLFSAASFWLESWGWYSATGLLLADISINPQLRRKLTSGFGLINGLICPSWVFALVLLTIGAVFKYIWTAFPQHLDAELVLHPTLHLSDSLNFDVHQPYPRLDDYLVVVGTMLLLECSTWLQRCFSARLMVHLGKRSLSVFVAQSLVTYTLGMTLFAHLRVDQDLSEAAAAAIVLVICIPVIFFAAEVFHWFVDMPGRWFAKRFACWLRE
ncbi:hypothetical protein LTR66_005695 [Elasticomyces elasticus]|nr:hypothetical protein LTR66_005695 [Elasticomyces elasticus]